MAIDVPRDLIEYLLLGIGDSRRYLQDTPILIDVWAKYAAQPAEPADLLITSHMDSTANALAAEIYRGIARPPGAENDPEIAPLQSLVAARLYFGEVLAILVPLTSWWQDETTQAEFKRCSSPRSTKLKQMVADVIALRDRWLKSADISADKRTEFERFVAVCTLVSMAGSAALWGTGNDTDDAELLKAASREQITTCVRGLLQTMRVTSEPMIWQVSLNRPATAAITQSVSTVKADAARRLFDIDACDINWAVIDSGIDSAHPAFGGRVKATYDFTNYRQIVSLGNKRPQVRKANVELLEHARGNKLPNDADSLLEQIADILVAGRPVPWDLVKGLVCIEKPQRPKSGHGTHVAGIIGACRTDKDRQSCDGMCPGIGLYDFRILASDNEIDFHNTEFAVIAALQFIRHLNAQAGRLVINGVNMSLSIPHNVKNHACGRTPICKESEKTIEAGVVVVAAAGNHGYEETTVADQTLNNYVACSITDPGNADRVITVGSTHRFAPFSHGVSYFSSRGPTGDGRLKPDLVAPGQEITAPLPEGKWGALDGTSMAAPHVSGAAAMLMARYSELIGNPDRIKRILCDSATDLGRERSFQGHGLLDVLRALQSQ